MASVLLFIRLHSGLQQTRDSEDRKHAKREPNDDVIQQHGGGAMHQSNFSSRLHKQTTSHSAGGTAALISSHRLQNYRQERDLASVGAGYQPIPSWQRSHQNDQTSGSLKAEQTVNGSSGGVCSQQIAMASSSGCVTSSDDEDQPQSTNLGGGTNVPGISPFNQYNSNQYIGAMGSGTTMTFGGGPGDQPTYYPTHAPCPGSAMPGSGYFGPYDPVMAGLHRLHGTASGHMMSMGGACGGGYVGSVNSSGNGAYYAGLMHAGIGRSGNAAACRYSPTPAPYAPTAGHVTYPAGIVTTTCLESSSPQSRDQFVSSAI